MYVYICIYIHTYIHTYKHIYITFDKHGKSITFDKLGHSVQTSLLAFSKSKQRHKDAQEVVQKYSVTSQYKLDSCRS